MRVAVWRCVSSLRLNKTYSGRKRTFEYLGCSFEQLKDHLEKDGFHGNPGISWENYGTHWHVDHITPIMCPGPDGERPDVETQMARLHFSNLQPMLAEENLRKGNRFVGRHPAFPRLDKAFEVSQGLGALTEGSNIFAKSVAGKEYANMGGSEVIARSAGESQYANMVESAPCARSVGEEASASTVASVTCVKSAGEREYVNTVEDGVNAGLAGGKAYASMGGGATSAGTVGAGASANTDATVASANSAGERAFANMVVNALSAGNVEGQVSASTAA
uniref:Uncharacterized protein n=1 Tax=Chromera velia CCMP2878 TaxID=1169474 RepID=A0A0G4I5L4_9ALVE|eukprot:Cvel_11200.t1-p1 / transcript=Cvel_11200.t1 / gene=Cvel_11200 / organism=Chromera_velia_CCMP2878 / gene_product=Zinc finger protein 283, putative / transcript_product=Zinc finger protein 283, putative / location=Cvel_scaffold696:16831-17965(+) / protein_length=276 / sequence_SO=supercontig / SO=protein_coding / is_pseudo=false